MSSISAFRATWRALAVAALALGATASLFGCDARPVTAPGAGDNLANQPRPAVSSPVSLGYGFLPAPPNSSGSAYPPVQLAAVPDSTWVVVEVSGAIQTTPNPLCDEQPPNWPCLEGPVTAAFEPGPTSQGMAPVWICTNSGPTCGGVRLRGSGGAGESAGTAIGLHFQTNGGALHGKLNLIAHTAWNSFSGPGVPTYLLRGGYNVFATAIPSPLQVAESAPDAGGTRTYSVQPVYGLQFFNPSGYGHLPAGIVRWYFFPGESVSAEPGFVGVFTSVAACDFATTCRFRPPGPGKMQSVAYVEGQFAMVRTGGRTDEPCSELTIPEDSGLRLNTVGTMCEEKPRLQVRCSPSAPIRGDSVSCTANVSPAEAFVVVGRVAQGKSNDFLVRGPDRDSHSATDSAFWSGVAVAPTRVTFFATVPSTQDTLRGSAEFGITARPWQRYEITNPARYPGVLGPAMSDWPRPLGEFKMFNLNVLSTPVTRVSGGPNDGLSILATAPAFADPRIGQAFVHPVFYDPPPGGFPPFTQLWLSDQNGDPPGSCTRAHFEAIRVEAERHEGFTVAPNSHVGVANREFRSRKLHEQFERLYTLEDESALRVRALIVWNDFYDLHYLAQKQFDNVDYATIGAAVGCSTDFNPANP